MDASPASSKELEPSKGVISKGARFRGARAKGKVTVKGRYEKRGWYDYQPPMPRDAPKGTPRPKAVALKTQDLQAALEKLRKERRKIDHQRMSLAGTLEEVLPAYHASKSGDAKRPRRYRESVLEAFKKPTGKARSTRSTRMVRMPRLFMWLSMATAWGRLRRSRLPAETPESMKAASMMRS